VSICTRNHIMTGVRFLFRVTLLHLAAEIYHIREPQKIPLVMLRTRRLLAVASSLKCPRAAQSPAMAAASVAARWSRTSRTACGNDKNSTVERGSFSALQNGRSCTDSMG
jgi:hypothetical protein